MVKSESRPYILFMLSFYNSSEEGHDYMDLAIVDNTRRYDSLPFERQPTGIETYMMYISFVWIY